MTLPRPALLAILGLALVAAAWLALRGVAGEREAPPAATTQAPPSAAARARRQAPSPPARAASPTTLPAPVERALVQGRPIVLFLSQAGGADDAATRRSVRSLRARSGGAAVFSDRIENIARYRRIVGNLDVSQAPSVVIVPRRRSRARLLEGFVDEASLRQQLVDTLR